MKQLKTVLLLLTAWVLAFPVIAQERTTRLTIQVTSVEGDNLNGQKVTLMQTDYQVSYGTLTLNAEGMCVLNVYTGNHQLQIEREGFNLLQYDFNVAETESEKTVNVTLLEKTRQPFALKTEVTHNVFDGTNSIQLSWNKEEPAFFDDFESYDPFSISFGEWTGIDADLEAAAPLVGVYPNRGVMQYAQIINPLTVNPTWWYDYPILRPYEGQQYVGFTRTSSGNANDDWLISPVVTVGTDNVLTFMGKAADRYPERFMVYVTTKLDNPVQTDFVRIDPGNYETADYTGWKLYSYDLSAYAGQQIKFAIRYISHYNRYGSFMLMVDDVYVGQSQAMARAKARRATFASPQNPNEKFRVLLDGQQVGITESYDYLIENVPAGFHTVGVKAVYLQAESEPTVSEVNIPANIYACVTFEVSANSRLSANGQKISVVSLATTQVYELEVSEGKAVLPSLPKGQYVVNIPEGAFEEYQNQIAVEGDVTISIELADHVIKPYNITATVDSSGRYTLRWNQELIFSDSFESYDDFATGTFGEWKSVDVDQQPVYPIALGSITNIVSFPGSGTGNTPMPIAPMVFNPWKTTPPMLPTDNAIAAPTGDKTVVFFSSQRAASDKWLISPLLDIHDDYLLTVKAKAYDAMYTETMEFCMSEGGDLPADFTPISTVPSVSAQQWCLYETDLSAYAGMKIRLAVHYTSYDAFLTQIDDFTVGPENGQGEIVDYGNVVRFEIMLDGEKIGESEQSVFVLPQLSEGEHVVGIQAVYQYAKSDIAEYVVSVTSSVPTISLATAQDASVYNLAGMYVGKQLSKQPAGIYFVKQNGKTLKVRK